jgi:hypothetical protein
MEYKIIIGRKSGESVGRSSHPQSKLQLLKVSLLTLLALAAVIGIFLAALVIGSVIASLLLILFGASLMVCLIRWVFLRFARTQKNL